MSCLTLIRGGKDEPAGKFYVSRVHHEEVSS